MALLVQHCYMQGCEAGVINQVTGLERIDSTSILPCNGQPAIRVKVLPLLLHSSIMGLEDEGQRTELTPEERERRATVPLLRRLVSERHRQEQQRSEADTRARQLQ
jgi:hypothetical protein